MDGRCHPDTVPACELNLERLGVTRRRWTTALRETAAIRKWRLSRPPDHDVRLLAEALRQNAPPDVEAVESFDKRSG